VFLDSIQSPVLIYLKTHNVSEPGFCLRLQVEPAQLSAIDRAGPCLRDTRTNTRQDISAQTTYVSVSPGADWSVAEITNWRKHNEIHSDIGEMSASHFGHIS
jgi:hypothetical protein